MTIVDKDGNELSTAAAVNPSGSLVRTTLDQAVKALTGPLSTLCEQVAGPRLAALGIGEWTARCWAHKRASSKDPEPMLLVHCRVTAAGDIVSERIYRAEVTEQHHAAFALRELGKDGGGELLAKLAVELIGLVVARAIMRLVDAGVLSSPTPAGTHENTDGATCTGCGAKNAAPHALKWACPVCGAPNAGPLLVQAFATKAAAP